MGRATHWLIGATLGLFVGFGLAYGQTNSYQTLQPFSSNWLVAGPGSGGGGAADVVAQFLFNESSSPIVDVVGGISLPDIGTSIYEQAVGGDWVNLTPGIQMEGGGNDGFGASTAFSALDVGPNDDLVYEAVVVNASTHTGIRQIISSWSTRGVFWYLTLSAASTATIRFEADDGSRVDWTPTLTVATPHDDQIRKHRLTFDHDGNAEYLIDGVSQGTVAVSSLSGKGWTNEELYLGIDNASYDWAGVFYEFRASIGSNALSNNSGGPGETSAPYMYGVPGE